MCTHSREQSGGLHSPVEMVASLSSDGFTTKERLALCLKPKYQVRRLENKGAILVLIWNFLLMKSYYFIDFESSQKLPLKDVYLYFYAIPACMSVIMPIAGWLADVHYGRYKVIYWSSLIMWISTVLTTLFCIIVQLLDISDKKIYHYTLAVVSVVLGVGYSCFQANIVQFGVDQLTDASTDELIAFINWYTFSFVGSQSVAYVIFSLTHKYQSLIALLLCVSTSVIVASNFMFKNVLIKEPVTRNPFKLIYNVLKYALKTKYPQQRSAFTYYEDELPTRLDFGKHKYGGPFTIEQVEDVKTCFRTIGLILLLSLVYGMTEEKVLKFSIDSEYDHNTEAAGKTGLWWSNFVVKNIYSITGALLIPTNEFIIHPLFRRCLPNVLCYWKVIIGIIIHLARYVVLIVLITMAQYEYIDSTTNYTTQCIFSSDTNTAFLKHTIDYRWFALSEALSAISFILIIVGTIEFYCAQVPYSMKGVVAGTFYGLFLLFHVVSNGIPRLFVIKSIWRSTTIFSCGFWYLVTKIILLVVFVAFLVIIVSCYKRRKREDVLPNEHIFAERYYDKSVD